jgi:hypothetical protein
MTLHRLSGTACLRVVLLSAGVCAGWSAAQAATAPHATRAGLRLQTDVSYTANLVHWVDNLAGTSAGKTMPAYRDHWRARFGSHAETDLQALRAFASLRHGGGPSPGARPGIRNDAGCMPVEADEMSWHQRFMAAAMEAGSVDGLARALYPDAPAERELLGASLAHFEPRFRQVWQDLGHVRAFEARFHRFLEQGGLPGYLDTLAAFFGVDAAATPPMRISFIGLPVDGPTHAEADGDHLLVEIRPGDTPETQIQVVAHEASHFLMRRLDPARVDALAAEALAQGEAGALVWRLMWEGIPTALGQGLAEARLIPERFTLTQRWYHLDSVDRFAKLIYPGIVESVAAGRPLDGPLMAHMARVVQGSSIFTKASPRDFLMTSFFVVGSRLDLAGQALQRRLGLASMPPASRMTLDDPRLEDLLRRYRCLPGVLLLGAGELGRAAALDGGLSLPARAMRQAADRAARGDGSILTGRRTGGGPVFVLVAPDADSAAPVMEKFLSLEGIPRGVVTVPKDRAPQR